MLTIKIDGLKEVKSKMDAMAKQIPFAAAVALTRTAKRIESQVQKDMGKALDKPTPWVREGTFTKPADKVTLTATVGIKDRQALYVKEHFLAGARDQKPYEKVLTGMGVLPSGYKTIPGAGLKLDARGNPNREQLREIIGALAARMQIYKGRGKRRQLVGYFVIKPGIGARLGPGVYWRSARAIKPVLVFVSGAAYRKRLDLAKTGTDVALKTFPRLFKDALDDAMRTAK